MSETDNGDDPIVRDLLPGYIARRHEELVRLQAALDEHDYATLRTVGHNLHGSGGAYGLPRLSELGKALESCARARDADGVAAVLAQMRQFLAAL